MQNNTAELMQLAYDQIATGYDQRWSVHIRAPQQRLTRELALTKGMRCADLGCGTAVDTLDMAERTAPEPVLAVDSSRKMLDEARRRAALRGHALETICTDAETFIREAPARSFDALSLRFCLAYLPWRDLLPQLARILRADGRLGILTNLGTSTPQALATYRGMVAELNVPCFEPVVPHSLEHLREELAAAGFEIESAWTHHFQLSFDSGASIAEWLAQSGFITHPALAAAPPELRRALWGAFADRIESFREARGIPLDFELAGVVAINAAGDC